MRHDVQTELISRALDHIERGTTDAGAPRFGPTDRYTEPARFERERRVLFRRYPIAVGFASQVAEPGAFLTHDATGVPILVNRDRHGELRAFVNACRHRGTRLVPEPSGNRTAFVCRYHAWSYGDDGALRGVPHEGGFPHVDRATCGLVRLPVRARCGVLWVVPDPASELDIDAYLDPLAAEAEGFGLGDHVLYEPRTYQFRANWKLAFDASLENYHVKVAHRDTIYPMFVDNVACADLFAPHVRAFYPKRTIDDLRGTEPATWDIRGHGNVIYYFFPGTIILVQPDHATVMTVSPTRIDGFAVAGGALIPEPPTTDKATRHWDRNVDIFWGALAEDFEMMEEMQRGVASGAIPQLHFGAFEHAAGWVHDAIDRALADSGDGG